MAASFGWGALAASSLVIGSVVALLFRINLRTIGLIMGFGAGVLISAVAFDLVEEAAGKANGSGWTLAGLFAGCGVFFIGDQLIDRHGGSERKDATGGQEGGSPLSIVLGTVLDGIPDGVVVPGRWAVAQRFGDFDREPDPPSSGGGSGFGSLEDDTSRGTKSPTTTRLARVRIGSPSVV